MFSFRVILDRRDFFRLWIGQIISSIGDRFYQFALLSLVLGLNSGTQVAKESSRIIFIGMLPGLLFAPLLGWIVDHWDRKKVLIACDLARVVLVLILIYVWFYVQNLAVVYFLVFCIGGMSCLFIPARQAILPQLVSANELVPANALISLVGVIASLVGAISAGILSAIFGARLSFVLTALGFAISAWFIMTIRAVTRPPEVEENRGWKEHWSAVTGGARYLIENRTSGWIIALISLFSFMSGVFAVSVLEYVITTIPLTPVRELAEGLTACLLHFAPKPPVFELKVLALGLLLLGLGSGLGLGIWSCSWLRRLTHWKLLSLLAVLLNGLGILLFAHVSHFYQAWLLCVWLGGCGSLWMIPLEARLQHEVPAKMRGRVFALRNLATTVAFMLALSINLSGDLIKVYGPENLIVVLGVSLTGFSLLAFGLRRKELKAFWG